MTMITTAAAREALEIEKKFFDEKYGAQASRRQIGLALSGGGIRSATFSLGVLQALAAHDLLPKLRYLSTVSGGGYIGAFFGRLFQPEQEPTIAPDDAPRVLAEVKKALTSAGSTPIQWLRENGRYLSPRQGGDNFFAVGIYLRNLLAIHLNIGLLLLGAFAFFNLVRALAADSFARFDSRVEAGHLWISPYQGVLYAVLIYVLIPMFWSYWLIYRRKLKPSQRSTSLMSAAVAAALYAIAYPDRFERALEATVALGRRVGVDLLALAELDLASNVGPRVADIAGYLWPLPLIAIAAATAARAWSKLRVVMTGRSALQDSGSVTDVRNVISGWTASALAIVVLIFLFVVVDTLGQTVYRIWESDARLLSLGALIPLLMTLGRFAAPLLGKDKTRSTGFITLIAERGLAIAGLILALLIATLWSAVSHGVMWGWLTPVGDPETGRLLALFAVAALFAVLTGRNFNFANLSSLHQFYQARLARAYLGAANPRRTGYTAGGATAAIEPESSVTTPLPGDDFRWELYKPHEYGAPLHIVNMTLNETVVSGSTLVYRDRKGMNFALSPYAIAAGPSDGELAEVVHGRQKITPLGAHSGENVFNARPWAETRKVGEWIAVSGAAFTTGSGSRTSPGQCLLLGLAGIRLGYWWNSGIRDRWSPLFFSPKLAALLSEFFARFRGQRAKRWYLSDGGHFENTGVYELLRRKLPLIILSDNGCDGNYDFDDVANLVRKARIDLHTEITFETGKALDARFAGVSGARSVFGSLEDLQPGKDAPGAKAFTPDRYASAHAALATIVYPDGATGLLVLLKPTLTGTEPIDVRQYANAHPDFPQEPTADQFFDEAQWESYRALGQHIGDAVFDPALAPKISPHL